MPFLSKYRNENGVTTLGRKPDFDDWARTVVAAITLRRIENSAAAR